MASESAEQWLAREVGELLDAGSVGLYELLWLLNGSDFELGDADKRAISYSVAASVVGAGRARLFELAWPSGEVLEGPFDLRMQVGGPDGWPVEAGEKYLALV